MTKTRAIAFFACLLTVVPAAAIVPGSVPNLPVLEAETTVGSIVASAATPVAPSPKTVDGDVADWTGSSTRLGGSAIYSHGEYVYQDYLNDAWGADDGFDAGRLANLDQLKDLEPRTYRADPLQQAAGDQFGAPQPIGALVNYGDANATDDQRNQADIEEVRIAADADSIYFLVRTLAMSEPRTTALLLLLDTEPGGAYSLPEGMSGVTTAAEWAFLIAANDVPTVAYKGGVDSRCPPVCDPFDVATNANGYANAIEVRIPRDYFDDMGGLPASLRIGLGSGLISDLEMPTSFEHVAQGDAQSDLINVAFRHEPARIWMDRSQALALRTGNIDEFLTKVDLNKMTGGATETFAQRPGYYEAIYVDDSSPANEERTVNSYFQGPFQHYGMYLPESWRPGSIFPAMFWMHYRGGHAHDAAAWLPGVLREFGDEPGMVVITPSARGTSSWYTGRGMVDFLDVWDDAMARLLIDPDHVYLGGHSMGGWASYLLGLLMPDRWAASNPEDGLVVPGLWTGVGSPSDPQNGGDVNAEFLVPFLENARNLPYAILHGTEDELVPVSSAISVGEKFTEMGYRHRLYLFHAYEHYSAPIWDDWRDIVRYMTRFRRDANPAHVTYNFSPALDHAVSTISAPDGVDLGLHFDHAYWISGLTTREPGAGLGTAGRIDATTYGRGVPNVITLPEAGTGGQAEPYTMTGSWWLPNGSEHPQNRFTADLLNVGTATFDLARMGIGTAERIEADITSYSSATLHLKGHWDHSPVVTGAAGWSLDGDTLTLQISGEAPNQIFIDP